MIAKLITRTDRRKRCHPDAQFFFPLHHAASRIILDDRKCSPGEDIYNKSLAHLACRCLEYPAAHFVLVSNKLFPDNLVDKRDSSPSDLHTSFKK